MADNLTIARPYAQAVFSLAKEHNNFDTWQQTLCALSTACSDSFYLTVLKNATNAMAAADNLIELLKDLLDDLGKNFVKILGENNRFEVVPEIYQEFLRLKQEHDKIITVQLISAHEIKDSDTLDLKKRLEAKYGCSVILNLYTDPSLIGGAILKIGDEVIDASYKNSLNQLSSTLNF